MAATDRPRLVTVTCRRSRERVTLERLGSGLYRSGCRRYLFVRRDRDGGTELVNHRLRPYAVRRLKPGWQVFDLETRFAQGLPPGPYRLYSGSGAETLRDAVEDVPLRQEITDTYLERGVLERLPEQATVSAALACHY